MLTSVPVVVESLAGITQHAVSMRRSRKEYTYIREKGRTQRDAQMYRAASWRTVDISVEHLTRDQHA